MNVKQPCLFSRVQSKPCSVGPSVSWFVPFFTFPTSMSFLSSLPQPKGPSDLVYHSPYPNARHWTSHVSGLFTFTIHLQGEQPQVGESKS